MHIYAEQHITILTQTEQACQDSGQEGLGLAVGRTQTQDPGPLAQLKSTARAHKNSNHKSSKKLE